MEMIPCDGCLTFSLCKARLYASGLQHPDGFVANTYGVTGMACKEKCQLLDKYIYPTASIIGRDIFPREEKRIKKARKLFGLLP